MFLQFGRPVETINTNPEDNDEQMREISTIHRLNDIDFKKEVKGLFYASKAIFNDLSGPLEERLKRFEGQEEGDLAIHTQEDLNNYLNYVEEILNIKQEACDIHIGIGILKNIYGGTWDDHEFATQNPYFSFRKEFIRKCVESIDFVDGIRRVNENIVTPERMSYVQGTGASSNSINELKNSILKRKYTQPRSTETYPTGSFTFGPIASIESNTVIKSTPENIDFHKQKTQLVKFEESIEVEELFDVVEGRDLQVDIEIPFGQLDEGKNDIELGCFDLDEQLIITFRSISLNISVKEDTIRARYPEPIKPVADKIFDLFSDCLDVKIYNDKYTDRFNKNSINDWVVDTNAVYHEIDENIGSSILRTVLTNRNLMESTIHIPWIVLYELNKHKVKGGPNKPIQENGLENLRLLEILSEHGFIDINFQKFPDDIPSNVQESSVSDLYLSKFAQDNDAAIITGDERLRKLNNISGVQTIDLYSYANVETIPDIEDQAKERVLNEIGENIEKHSDIINKLKNEIEKAGSNKMEHHKSIPNRQIDQEKLPESASEYLQQWIGENELIAYPSPKPDGENSSSDDEETEGDHEKELRYEKTSEYNVVPTMSVVSEICGNIYEFQDEKYLNKKILEKFKELVNYQETGKPTMHFHFPVASVISYQSKTTGRLSREGTKLYKLKQLVNSNYTTEELSQADRDDVIHDSVLLAKENDCALLCGDDEEYLQRIGELIGVNVIQYH